ncbi:ABC transporter permease [Metasolibacillus sp.]|uniref:FtsX-like permease family protein n=1 Tax=Metasolibacillus sp. TaxID=2703680 RepID=UPI0025F4DD3B|nr:ABC transporter permease [Metasolibacillus sp.]MCT6924494.1 ABC transporter permease [Metasolibacillus sp.]MCT6940697.1 ABC transporter permease [Metasolibacillus sp.]
MTLFDLALKNMRRNMKSYALYFGAVLFSIVIYFTFVTLKYSDDISALADSSMKVQGIMSASSVVLLIFVALFIIYANSFFIKKRKKEVGLYSLLGVRKKQIGFLLFFENIVLGILSLVIGIVLGFLLSKGLLTILVRLMGLDAVASFTLSGAAVLNTTIVFMVVFLFTSLQGYRVIYQFKLIELFHAEKKGENLPRAKWVATVAGIAFLAFGYWLALQDLMTSKMWAMLGISTPIIIVLSTVAGTYLLFHSALVFVLTKLKNNERWAWRGLNLLSVSQILYRIRANSKTLTTIAVLSATTITAGGAVYGMYYNAGTQTHHYLPNTFMWKGEAADIPSQDILYNETIYAKQTELNSDERIYNYTFIDNDTYNKLAKLQQREQLAVQSGEAIMLDSYYDERFSTDYTGQQFTVGDVTIKVKDFRVESVLNANVIAQVIVVSTEDYQALDIEANAYQVVAMDNDKKQIAASNKLQQQLGDETYLSSFPATYKASIESLGSLLFVGSFLGLVFLVATGSIIYFKIMTEAEEDRGKYEILHKIGVGHKEMKKTVRVQIGFIFTAPLIMGIMHSAFALSAFSGLMSANIAVPVIIWMAVYVGIYAVIGCLAHTQFSHNLQWGHRK